MSYYKDLGIFLYLIPIIMSVSFALTLLILRCDTKQQRCFTACLFALSVGMFVSFFYDRYVAIDRTEILRPVNLSISFFCATIVLFYSLSVFRPHKLTGKTIVMTLGGFLLFISVLFTADSFFPVHTRIIAAIALAAFEFGIAYMMISLYSSYLKRNKDIDSGYGKSVHRWFPTIAGLLIAFAALDFIWMLSYTIYMKIFFNLTSSFLIAILFFVWFRQNNLAPQDEEKETLNTLPNPYNLPLTQLSAKERKTASMLLNYFKEKKAYLNPDLSLAQVSEELGVNMTYLSKFINRVMGINFYTFVNHYRINHAIMLIMEKEGDITSDMLYNEAGFKSRSLFFKLFKEHTGLSPQEYIRKNIK